MTTTTHTPIRVLLVDDDVNLLSALRRVVYAERDRWRVSYAATAADALELLNAESFDVVVSDMQMPIMNGAELLRHVREVQPAAVRIVLTGQADSAASQTAASIAHQFLAKPAETSMLKRTIESAGALSRQLSSAEMRATLGAVDALPTPPAVLTELSRTLHEESVAVGQIATVIESDPALTAKVIRTANAAIFARPRHVASITEAVTYLGINNIRAIATTLSVFGQLETAPNLMRIGARLQADGFSVLSLAKRILPETAFAADLFTAAMLHDIGTLAMATLFPSEWVILTSFSPEERTLRLEKELFGATHADIGAYLLSLWGLTAAVHVVAGHHNPLPNAPTDSYVLEAIQLAVALQPYEDHPEDVPNEISDFVRQLTPEQTAIALLAGPLT